MVKNHMKRLTAPVTWKVKRKEVTFITKPNPGAHSKILSTSINTFLKEIVGVTKTTKETKYLLTKQEVIVNGKRIRDDKYAVGLFDVVKIPSVGKSFRIIVDSLGKLSSVTLKNDSSSVLLKVTGKTVLGKDKVQINTMSGRNLRLNSKDVKDYKIGDSLIVKVPENKIEMHIKKEKGVHVFIFFGKHAGKQGTLEEIKPRTIIIKVGDELVETSRKYMIITGKNKQEFEVA